MFSLILLQRIAFRLKLSFTAEIGPEYKKRPDLALTDHRRRGHLTPAEILAYCRDRT